MDGSREESGGGTADIKTVGKTAAGGKVVVGQVYCGEWGADRFQRSTL